MIQVFEWSKIIHALNRTATGNVISLSSILINFYLILKVIFSQFFQP